MPNHTCPSCQTGGHTELRSIPNGGLLCVGCWELDYTECAECSCTLTYDHAERSQVGTYYCDSCYTSRYANCIDCGAEIVRHSTDHHHLDNQDFCHCCYNDRFVTCGNCGTLTDSSETRNSPNGDNYCAPCYEESVIECYGCGCSVWRDEAYNNSHGYQCNNCRRSGRWDIGRFAPEEASFNEIGSERCFGVELETSECEDYHELEGETCFGCKPDGSVDGMEFVSPILYGDQGLEEIRKVCRLAREREFKIDTSCGLHVHLDLRNATEDQLYSIALAYHYTYDLWTSFVSNSRVRNYYCAKHEYGHTDIRAFVNFRDFVECATHAERYRWINWASYMDHSTVESRIHGGTLNARKVINWVKANARFVDAVQDMPISQITRLFGGKDTCEQFEVFATIMNDDELVTYLADRAEHFGKSVVQSDEPKESAQPLVSAQQEDIDPILDLLVSDMELAS